MGILQLIFVVEDDQWQPMLMLKNHSSFWRNLEWGIQIWKETGIHGFRTNDVNASGGCGCGGGSCGMPGNLGVPGQKSAVGRARWWVFLLARLLSTWTKSFKDMTCPRMESFGFFHFGRVCYEQDSRMGYGSLTKKGPLTWWYQTVLIST